MKRIAVYPGSFDPVTCGHLDLIQRGSMHADELVVSVLSNEGKEPAFSLEQRLEMLREVTADMSNVRVDSFRGLLVDYARQIGATIILRGIRAVSDFEYELQMALMNRKLEREIETVFMMPSLRYIFLSSTIIKEAVSYGGDVSGLVPPNVETALREKYDR